VLHEGRYTSLDKKYPDCGFADFCAGVIGVLLERELSLRLTLVRRLAIV
jgi:hypothetical protein